MAVGKKEKDSNRPREFWESLSKNAKKKREEKRKEGTCTRNHSASRGEKKKKEKYGPCPGDAQKERRKKGRGKRERPVPRFRNNGSNGKGKKGGKRRPNRKKREKERAENVALQFRRKKGGRTPHSEERVRGEGEKKRKGEDVLTPPPHAEGREKRNGHVSPPLNHPFSPPENREEKGGGKGKEKPQTFSTTFPSSWIFPMKKKKREERRRDWNVVALGQCRYQKRKGEERGF